MLPTSESLKPAERLIKAAAKLARQQGYPVLKFNVNEVAAYLREKGNGAYKNPQAFVDRLVAKAPDRVHIKPRVLPSKEKPPAWYTAKVSGLN